MDCPACPGAPLEQKEPSDGLVVDLCAACGGAWLDAGELYRLVPNSTALKDELGRAGQALAPTEIRCPRCLKSMSRARLAEAKLELDVCLACQGTWFERSDLHGLRGFLERKASLSAAPSPVAAPPAAPVSTSRAVMLVVCLTAAGWLAHRLTSARPSAEAPPLRPQELPAQARPVPAAAADREERAEAPPAPAGALRIDRNLEREARKREQRALAAEALSRPEEAEAEQEAAARLYYAAIVAAAPKAPGDAWRLELDYARVGQSVAKTAVLRRQYGEAEKIQKITLDIFERHGSAEGQALAWQGLAQISEKTLRYAEAAERFDKAAYLFRQAKDFPNADQCEMAAVNVRRAL